MPESQREKAVEDVRGFFILQRIVEAEQIEASDEELNQELTLMARANNQALSALKARLTKEGAADTIKNRIRYRKALDLVADAAIGTLFGTCKSKD